MNDEREEERGGGREGGREEEREREREGGDANTIDRCYDTV